MRAPALTCPSHLPAIIEPTTAAGWENGGVRYTAANCNKLLRIQANALSDQPSINVCQNMFGSYYCAEYADANVTEPRGSRFISGVTVRYRTFGSTYRFTTMFYKVGFPFLLVGGQLAYLSQAAHVRTYGC